MSKGSDNIEHIEKLQLNRFLKNHLIEVVAEREEKLIRTVVREYQSGELTAQRLFGIAGEFVSLRTLLDTVDRDISRGLREIDHGTETETAS